ncbi:unnamed protein product [Blepharisma stoltei]|uniref:histidine kinase n=1 Tax=Blepharisma stoltei TaxID=1481888 RepID=A0AAU9JX13_9CILI|nr:unnamed protein product [Blepharisma stoltei]
MGESSYNLWWEEEVNQKFPIFKKYLESARRVYAIFWITYLIISPENLSLFIKTLPYTITHYTISFTVSLLEHKSPAKKFWFPVLYVEYCQIALWVYSLSFCSSHPILFEMLGSLLMGYFELPFIKSKLLTNLILIKHVILWHYYKYFSGNYNDSECMIGHAVGFLHILAYNYILHQTAQAAHEKYLYRKGKEKAENQLEVIISAFPDGFFVISEDNTIEYANIKMLNLLACSQHELPQILSSIIFCPGKKYSNLSQNESLAHHMHAMFDLEFNFEIMLGISISSNINLEWKGSKILWESKPALLITARNANSIIQLERTIAEDKFKTVLLRTVSHELRTPLNAISLLTEELIQEPSTSEICRDKLSMISVSTRLLLTLVSDLLDFSRMLAGVFSVQKSWFSLQEVVKGACDLIHIQAKKKNIALVMRVDPSLPRIVYSDPLRLSQVLLNLLSNALKFTMSGFIEIICLLDRKNYLKIIVQDSGIGIDKASIVHLFDEFYTSSLQAINPQGCGLGLPISNKIVKELGNSHIEVESAKGKGSAFSFSVSIFEENQSLDAHLSDTENNTCEEINFLQLNTSTTNISNPQVLIVDDNDMNRAIVSSLLSHNKINILEACTGKQAINMIIQQDRSKNPFKVIIMDGEMPELDGWETTKIIVDLKRTGEIKSMPNIIGYTAYSSDEDIKQCIQCGMKECLTKPCTSEALISTILKYL